MGASCDAEAASRVLVAALRVGEACVPAPPHPAASTVSRAVRIADPDLPVMTFSSSGRRAPALPQFYLPQDERTMSARLERGRARDDRADAHPVGIDAPG